METAEDGAYAACGIFLPSFLDKLTRADQELTKQQKARLNRFLKEIGKGARQILKVHRGLSEIKASVELNQTSIKNFLVKKSLPVPPSEDSGSEGDGGKNYKKKKNRKKIKRSIYVNPISSSDSDSEHDDAPRIKNPPSTSFILRNYFNYNVRGGVWGEVVYWEWKAG